MVFPSSRAMYSHALTVSAIVVRVGPQVPPETKQLESVTNTLLASQHWLYELSTDFLGSLPILTPPHSWMEAPNPMLFLKDLRNMNLSNQPPLGSTLSGSSSPSALPAKSIPHPLILIISLIVSNSNRIRLRSLSVIRSVTRGAGMPHASFLLGSSVMQFS